MPKERKHTLLQLWTKHWKHPSSIWRIYNSKIGGYCFKHLWTKHPSTRSWMTNYGVGGYWYKHWVFDIYGQNIGFKHLHLILLQTLILQCSLCNFFWQRRRNEEGEGGGGGGIAHSRICRQNIECLWTKYWTCQYLEDWLRQSWRVLLRKRCLLWN